MDQEQIQAIEIGKKLYQLKQTPGWTYVQAILSEFENDRLNELLGYAGADSEILRSKQLSARLIRELNKAINQRIDEAIDEMRQIYTEYAIQEEIL